MTLGYRTYPGRVGAPLPEEMSGIDEPTPMAILAELRRAKVELMYAIARHRQAWSHMRKVKLEREADALKKGVPAYLDNDVFWKIATADVSWWRGEMQAQAATVTALMAMAEQMTGWAETTTLGDRAAGRRTFIPAEDITAFGPENDRRI